MSRLAWLFAPSGEGLSFAIRCCLSVAISLWLAFYLELDNAYWAFINVAILIQPLPGFLVVRSVARLAGTFMAAFMSIVLIALFAQSYTLYSVGLIIWVATMVFCANQFRNNLSYGFVLAGYVTAIISVRTMSDPNTIFPIAVARTAETTVAALVAAFVSVLLAPGLASRKYFQARIDALKSIGRHYRVLDRSAEEIEDETDPNTPHPQLHALVEKTLTLEQTRQYARFDSPQFAGYDRLARRLDYELLSIVSAMAALQVYLARLGDQANRGPLKRLDRAAALLEADPGNTQQIKHAFGRAYNEILSGERRADASPRREHSLADWVVISRSLDLASRLRATVIKHGLLTSERSPSTLNTSSRNEFSTSSSVGESLNIAIRSAAAMGAGAIIWATHHDQSALTGTMVLLAVLTTLFALNDSPTMGARGFGIGALCAAGAAFVVDFVILPQVTQFVMLMVVILPFVFVAGLAMINPSTALLGRVGLVVFALLLHPANNSRQDFVSFFESFLGVELAVILALAAFALVLPVTPRDLLRKRLAGIFAELSHGFAESRERFETRVYDRLVQLPISADEGRFHVSARQAAFAAVNMGIEARSLRLLADRARFSVRNNQAIGAMLTDLEGLFKHGYPQVERVFELQWEVNQLAHRLLDEAMAFARRRRFRYGVRAAVSTELIAAALADYGQARENTGDQRIRLGETNRVT